MMSHDLFERRQAERRYALKFLDYEILSSKGEITGRGLARTLNVSENGLRLETGQFFEPEQTLRITLGLDNNHRGTDQGRHGDRGTDINSAGYLQAHGVQRRRVLMCAWYSLYTGTGYFVITGLA